MDGSGTPATMRMRARGLSKLPRYWKTVAVFITMTVLQALAAALSIELLSTVRAYVTGESLYSKGQMNAQIHLLDYAQSHREEDYQAFVEALRVPLGDRLAREALQQSPPNVKKAKEGLLEGGNSPDDIDGAIRLFVWFHDVPFLFEPISTWTKADRIIERMRMLVDRARERIVANDLSSPDVARMREEAPHLNRELTELERNFARQLGDASRTVQRIVLALNGLIAVILSATGIAFVRRTYEAQATTEAQIAASQAKTQFLSRMSHELRTPLNAVIGFVQLLRMDTVQPLSKQQLDRLSYVEVAGEHLLALVDEVLDLSKIESGNMSLALEDVRIVDVVDEAVTMVSPLVTKAGIEVFVCPFDGDRASLESGSWAAPSLFAVASAPADVWLKADRLRVRQVLVNLISNAVKYNRPGGNVSITWKEAAGICELKVIDTGEGIPSARLKGLFEPFNRLGAENSRVEGTGIGLVLSRQLVEMMGGTLTVDSELGSGTTATLRLKAGPVPTAAENPIAEPEMGPEATTVQRFNVLYAEDNEVNAELVRQVMTLRPAVALRLADSGAAALEMATLDPPDLFLVDMNLGDMTGIELAQALRLDRATRDVHLIALSADALPEQIDVALRSGFERYLTKPIDFKELLAVIDAYSAAP